MTHNIDRYAGGSYAACVFCQHKYRYDSNVVIV